MNLNDLRANAYVNMSKEENKDKKKNENPVVKAFMPPVVHREQIQKAETSQEDLQKAFKPMNLQNGFPFAVQTNSSQSAAAKKTEPAQKASILQKNVQSPADNKNPQKMHKAQPENQISASAVPDYIKAGGLLKVPVAPPEKDGKESVYRRVAKFLLLIGIDEAAKIMPHLTPEQTEKIIPELVTIKKVDPSEAEEIFAEFQQLLTKARESGGVETAREILEKVYGADRAKEMLEKISPFKGAKPFDYLNDADSQRIHLLLSDESPQIRALILSHLEPKKAASVINIMEPEDKKDVIQRLAKMEPVSPDVLKRIDHAMHEKSLKQTTEKAEYLDGKNALASILKKMSPEAENEIIANLAEDDPELGMDLRSRLFTIDDVIDSDDRFIQEQLRKMEDSEIAMLLAKKSDAFAEKILSCVSAGRRASIREEQAINSPYRKSDCERVTSQFFAILRRAFESGSLIIKGRNDDIFV